MGEAEVLETGCGMSLVAERVAGLLGRRAVRGPRSGGSGAARSSPYLADPWRPYRIDAGMEEM